MPKTEEQVREAVFKLLFPYSDIKRAGDDDMVTRILSILKQAEQKPPSYSEWEAEIWLANYLTERFICDPKELPPDECLGEAKIILAHLASIPIDEGISKIVMEGLADLASPEVIVEYAEDILSDLQPYIEAKIYEAEKRGAEKLATQLDLHENEMGFCGISNHIPFGSLSS